MESLLQASLGKFGEAEFLLPWLSGGRSACGDRGAAGFPSDGRRDGEAVGAGEAQAWC